MRYRVKFRYREDTGEVETFQVDTAESVIQAADHDAQHDRVAAELAGVLERDALVEELRPAPAALRDQQARPPARDQQAQPEPGRTEQLGG